MELWNQVEKTDPAHTKKFTKGGGFSGTAIKPFYLVKKATETFGICGIGWGWTELENLVVGGVWCSKVELWFTRNNQRGVIEQWGQTVMQGKNKNGDFVDEEAPKKAVTDAVMKCLSYLGFAGDVHLGRFDDSKYVAEVAAEIAKEKLPSVFESDAIRQMFLDNTSISFDKAETADDLNEIAKLAKPKMDEMRASGHPNDLKVAETLSAGYKDRLKFLGAQKKPKTVDDALADQAGGQP